MKGIEEAILNAGKEMIDREGVHSISARKLVAASGCSLRSLYNKFESMGSVFTMLIDIFTQEIADSVTAGFNQSVENDNDLYNVHSLFISHFLRHPNRFYFIYMYKHDEISDQKNLFETEEFQEQMRQSFSFLYRNRGLDQNQVEQLRSNIMYGMFGLLTLYFTGKFGLSEEHVQSEFKKFFFAQLSANISRNI